MVRNAWGDEVRKLINRQRVDTDISDIEIGKQPELDFDERERLDRAISRLPERLREPVELFYIEGWSYKDIAERLGLTVAAVKSRLFNARYLLRKDRDVAEIVA